MENRKIKNDNQAKLFDLIQKEFPNKALVDIVSGILDISYDSAYRRIRGDMKISFEEAIKLSENFQISIDSFANVTRKNQIQCGYYPLDLSDPKDYLSFIQSISDNIEKVQKTPGSEIILSTVDVPLFNLFIHRELTFFKIFSWHKSIYGYNGNFETFVNESETYESLIDLYEKIVKNYQLIPSSEIWTANTIDTILRLISYHVEMGHFSTEDAPLRLCDQLLILMDTLLSWAESGTKGPKNVPFKFYVSETDIANTFILFKTPERSNCLLRLYTINGLSISDESFCRETESWLNNSIQRASLISKTSEKERHKFFNVKKQKIRYVIQKIQTEFKNHIV